MALNSLLVWIMNCLWKQLGKELHWWKVITQRHTCIIQTLAICNRQICIVTVTRGKFLQNFISSRDRPVKSTETRQGYKYTRLPYLRTMAERKTRNLPYTCCIRSRCRVVFLRVYISALFLYFLLEIKFCRKFFPSVVGLGVRRTSNETRKA